MTLVAITGDGTTTLTLALAASWRTSPIRRDASIGGRSIVDDVLVVEADPDGGSLAAWLDTPAHPSLATVAAAIGRGEPATETIRTMAQRTASGLLVVTAPTRRAAADRAIAELPDLAIEALAGSADPVLLDLGAARAGSTSRLLGNAGVVVLAHRQRGDTARAESARLERLAESAEWLAALGPPLTLTVTGTEPFDPAEIVRFVDDAVDGDLSAAHALPDDPMAAAVLSGRTGVSARRLGRLPLMRAAAQLVEIVAPSIHESTGPLRGATR